MFLTPRQETNASTPPLSLLRIDHSEQETSLQPLLKPFTALTEPDLISPSLSPQSLSHDRNLTAHAGFHFSVDSRLGSLEGEEESMQSEEEMGGERQERVMNQGSCCYSSGSEKVSGVEEVQTKAVGTRAFGLLRDIL